ncbi:MAG: aspartyl protease family protein [Gemmataceae bacterium]|nr:aspartyl protease family protein [Gemmataceae bacterium]
MGTLLMMAALAAPAKAVVVPFEMLKSGHMAVQVKVNGKGPFKLIFDTGAPMSLVNNKLAEEAGLLKGKAKPLFTLFGSVGDVVIKELRVGDQSAEDVPAIVMDHPTVELLARHLKEPIHGLVGFPFFARFKLTIDYKAKTMTLEPSGYKPPDIMKAMMKGLLSSGHKALAPSAQWGLLATKDAGDEDEGVDVKGVVPGSAAEKAGLKRGDRLLTLDGRWTDSMVDLYEAAGFVKPGTTVALKVKRDGKEVELKATPARGL